MSKHRMVWPKAEHITEPGMYRALDGDNQEGQGEYHTDGYQFYYLNTSGKWSDIGWGSPYDWVELERLTYDENRTG